jgi:Putative metallopeptidase
MKQTAVLLCVLLAGCEQPPSEPARIAPLPSAESVEAAPQTSFSAPPRTAGVERPRFAVLAAADGSRRGSAATAWKAVLDSRALTDFADQLSELVAMRQAVTVDTQACGKSDASYDRDAYRIAICDELVRDLGETLFANLAGDRAEQAVVYAVTLTFLHEAGHALVHQLALPIEGSEEDAADQFAAYILGGNPDADQTAMNGAPWFGAMFEAANAPAISWDGHALDAQRFVKLNCWVLGSNPDGYAWLVDPRIVPAERAARCPSEWARLERSFSTLLTTHLR